MKDNNLDDLKAKTEALNQASMKVGQAIYGQSKGWCRCRRRGEEEEKDDKTVDADFEEKKDEEKKDDKEEKK